MLQGKIVILFDMDGTLIGSVGVWNAVDHQLITELGGQAEETEIQRQRDALLRKYSTVPDSYRAYCRDLGEKYNSGLMTYEIIKRRYEIATNF